MAKFTKEQVKDYYKGVRETRKEAKELSEKMGELENEELAKIQLVLPKMSATGYMFAKIQMKRLGYSGFPGIDAKTFQGWQEFGYVVKKGEKSQMYGITWIKSESKEGEEDERMFPKVYKLFHSSQVEPIA